VGPAGVSGADLQFWRPGKMPGFPTGKMPVARRAPLTAWTPQITITNEYRTRPRGDTSHSKPRAKA
jgi:hypothetical protein